MYHIYIYVHICMYTAYCIYVRILRFQFHCRFLCTESEKVLKGPKHVACIKTHSSVRRYWTVYLLNTVMTMECPPLS